MSSLFNFIRRQLKDVLQIQRKQHNSVIWVEYAKDFVHNKIALDSGNKITQSIPLGHLGNFDSMFTPQRFVEQIVAFEYLFDKLEHKKAQNLQFPLKKELEYMFNEYPQLLSQTNLSAEKVSNQIKEIRRTIAHGYAYYYDFKNDRSSKYLMILLDKLIRCMSLKLIGFSNDDISNFMPFYP